GRLPRADRGAGGADAADRRRAAVPGHHRGARAVLGASRAKPQGVEPGRGPVPRRAAERAERVLEPVPAGGAMAGARGARGASEAGAELPGAD
ncbi:hypothetical protein ABTB15_19440, partial [Acinetobacter baumannii]